MSCRKNRQQKTTLKSLLILFQSVHINAYGFNNDLPSDDINKELESLAKNFLLYFFELFS